MTAAAALLVGLAVLAGSASAPRTRLVTLARSSHGMRPAALGESGAAQAGQVRPPPPWQRWAATAGAGAGLAALVGGPVGVLAGALSAAVLARWLARLEPAAARRDREALAAALPVVADLIAECLSAGMPAPDALRVVADALGGPVQRRLRPAVTAAGLGADPALAFAELSTGPLAPLGRVLERSTRTGASPVPGLVALATEARARSRAAAEAKARSVGTRAAAPLGLCFLPAFLLLGIVPLVVSLARQALG